MDLSYSHSSSSCHAAQDSQPRKIKQCSRPSTPINPTTANSHHPWLSFRILITFWQRLWSFKLLGPSPSSDEDEWGGHSSSHYTMELVSDCPTVTVHADKRCKVLIDSGAALLLVNTSIYDMTEDQYKTKILPAAVHLKTVDESAMSSLGKATLHLHTANFKFSHTFIICDKLLDTDILFGINIQKRYSLSYSWDADKQLFIQREGTFLTYTRNCEQQHNIAVVESPLQISPRCSGIIPVTIKGHNI